MNSLSPLSPLCCLLSNLRRAQMRSSSRGLWKKSHHFGCSSMMLSSPRRAVSNDQQEAGERIQYSLKTAWANGGGELTLPNTNEKLGKKSRRPIHAHVKWGWWIWRTYQQRERICCLPFFSVKLRSELSLFFICLLRKYSFKSYFKNVICKISQKSA